MLEFEDEINLLLRHVVDQRLHGRPLHALEELAVLRIQRGNDPIGTRPDLPVGPLKSEQT